MSTAAIVCAVNETEGAAEALRAATHLGRRPNMRLVAVHVVEDVPMSAGARREARAGGLRLVDRVGNPPQWTMTQPQPCTTLPGSNRVAAGVAPAT